MAFLARMLMAVALLSALTPASSAGRLQREACEGLKGEQVKLVSAGAKSDMQRGPEWAKANLTPDRLQRIERLIDVEEQLAFRCPQPRPTAKVPAAPQAGSDRASPAATAAQQPAEKETVAKPRRQKRSVAKPKTDDAYTPAAKQSSGAATSQ